MNYIDIANYYIDTGEYDKSEYILEIVYKNADKIGIQYQFLFDNIIEAISICYIKMDNTTKVIDITNNIQNKKDRDSLLSYLSRIYAEYHDCNRSPNSLSIILNENIIILDGIESYYVRYKATIWTAEIYYKKGNILEANNMIPEIEVIKENLQDEEEFNLVLGELVDYYSEINDYEKIGELVNEFELFFNNIGDNFYFARQFCKNGDLSKTNEFISLILKKLEKYEGDDMHRYLLQLIDICIDSGQVKKAQNIFASNFDHFDDMDLLIQTCETINNLYIDNKIEMDKNVSEYLNRLLYSTNPMKSIW